VLAGLWSGRVRTLLGARAGGVIRDCGQWPAAARITLDPDAERRRRCGRGSTLTAGRGGARPFPQDASTTLIVARRVPRASASAILLASALSDSSREAPARRRPPHRWRRRGPTTSRRNTPAGAPANCAGPGAPWSRTRPRVGQARPTSAHMKRDTYGETPGAPRRKCPDGPSPRNSLNHDSCSTSSLRMASASS
jgi:hypothetical protein